MLFSFQRPQPSRAGPTDDSCRGEKKPLRREAPERPPSGGDSQSTLRLGRIRSSNCLLGQRESVAVIFGFLKALEDIPTPVYRHTGEGL